MTSVTETRIKRLEERYGKLEERHGSGTSSLAELKDQYKGRFRLFSGEVLGIEYWTPAQLAAIARLEAGATQVVLCGGQGTGKDTLTAAWALYEAFVLGSLVLLSGATDRQVHQVLMRHEIAGMWRHAAGKLPGERYERAIRIPGHERGGILAFTSGSPEKFVGHHAPRIFIALTEGQALEAEIFQAAQRCKVGSGAILVSCNPTSTATAVYSLTQSGAWETLVWSCLDHPNVLEGREVIPGAVTLAWVELMRAEHGVASPFWSVAVLGQFPDQAVDSLVQPSWIDAGVARWEAGELGPTRRTAAAMIGLDVARSGSDFCVAAPVLGNLIGSNNARRGKGVILREFVAWRGLDLMATTHKVRELSISIERDRTSAWRMVDAAPVVVDMPGLGSGVYDRMEELNRDTDARVKAIAFNGWTRRAAPARATNDRAESHWLIREGLERGTLAIPPDAMLREELLSVRWSLDARGQVLMESKDLIRPRLKRSPDRLDALSMALFGLAENARRTPSTFLFRV